MSFIVVVVMVTGHRAVKGKPGVKGPPGEIGEKARVN